MEWNSTDLDDLKSAVGLLENPGLIAKVSDVVGTPVEYVLKTLPKGAGDTITKVTHDSLMAAVNLAVKTIDPRGGGKPRTRSHQALAGLAGGVGGAFGLSPFPSSCPSPRRSSCAPSPTSPAARARI